MKQINEYKIKDEEELKNLCINVKQLIEDKKFQESELLIRSSMGNCPHSPEPHNLMGILLEKKGNHSLAMKHFRVSWALDPTYLPAQHNLEHYGNFYSKGKCAYDDSDCIKKEKENLYEIEYDERGIGHVVSKYKVEYDEKGVGRVVRKNKNVQKNK